MPIAIEPMCVMPCPDGEVGTRPPWITCGGVIPGLRADGCQPNGLTIVMVVTGSVCRSGVGVCGRTLASQGDDRR
jgi:hypothetical protein